MSISFYNKVPYSNEGRDYIVDYLKSELIGPRYGDAEVIDESPHKRYTLGLLFPRNVRTESEIGDEEEESKGAEIREDSVDDPVTLSGQYMPSSMGMSFYFVGGPEVTVSVYGARYVKLKGRKDEWQRESISSVEDSEKVKIEPGEDGKCKINVLGGFAYLQANWRKFGEGFLITVSLVNSNDRQGSDINGEHCICQTGFCCRVNSGAIVEYPTVKVKSSDHEEEEIQLLYRRNKVYGVGHGCSVDWKVYDLSVDLSTEVMPSTYVPGISHVLDESFEVLSVSYLANPNSNRQQVVRKLEEFVFKYEEWIKSLDSVNKDIPQRLIEARNRLLLKLTISAGRMRSGVKCLEQDDLAWNAFQFANLAMLMQMRWSKNDMAGGLPKKRNNIKPIPSNYFDLENKWRPFQLAFQLLVVESLINPKSEFREVTDLIWFPTGGGKTEAYLTIAALEIFYRRLNLGEKGGGTAVITRYTLRLLTSQQFLRATRLIAACEAIRKKNKMLGLSPISIGFWAGGDTSPNTFDDAVKKFSDIVEDPLPKSKNCFQIDNCPCCGTELLPERNSGTREDFGFDVKNDSIRIFCPTSSCLFHDYIPVSVVDESLYRNPPTFLIATVDKFARLAWIEGGVSFFGANKYHPPSLVIQDELHLLSGPLGTTVGLYECAFEGLMRLHGAKPKIIASTATIRRAQNQVNSLFGRSVMLFPSPGLTFDDSYFSKVDTSKKGRLYLGVMSSSHRATTSVVRTAASLLQAVEEIDFLTNEEKDAYWTLIVYHMSLRELGKTVSFSRDDIPSRIKIIASSEDTERDIKDESVLELTSNLNAVEIPESLKRMELPYSNSRSVSILACTNMLSVGVDVPRLGIMLVNGQPKSTSEYIQATSRVGRGAVPGLVITHFSASKPRDRSHYESFVAYHNSIYKYVEPSSVTPFSLPSRNRALHAALVILVRHGAGLTGDSSAIQFDPSNPNIKRVIKVLEEQAAVKDPQEFANTKVHLRRLVDDWRAKVYKCVNSGYPLVYSSKSRQVSTLLKSFGEIGDGWPTLHSMRNVDSQCNIKVLGED